MSATFIGNGRRALLLGCNQQIVLEFEGGPYRFHGVIGPLAVPAPVRRELARMLDALTEAFALRGLGSLDFLLDGQTIRVLEVNPRPSASLELYPQVGDRPVLRAHLAACAADGNGNLPDDPWRRGAMRDDANAEVDAIAATVGVSAAEQAVHGTEIVFAPHPVRLTAAAAAQLARLPATHDLPRGAEAGAHATHFAPGEPLCSVSASGADAASVLRELARRRDAVLDILQTLETVE
jgi:predicted ATP-grasp superfamily ATP-dependent carboligase